MMIKLRQNPERPLKVAANILFGQPSSSEFSEDELDYGLWEEKVIEVLSVQRNLIHEFTKCEIEAKMSEENRSKSEPEELEAQEKLRKCRATFSFALQKAYHDITSH